MKYENLIWRRNGARYFSISHDDARVNCVCNIFPSALLWLNFNCFIVRASSDYHNDNKCIRMRPEGKTKYFHLIKLCFGPFRALHDDFVSLARWLSLRSSGEATEVRLGPLKPRQAPAMPLNANCKISHLSNFYCATFLRPIHSMYDFDFCDKKFFRMLRTILWIKKSFLKTWVICSSTDSLLARFSVVSSSGRFCCGLNRSSRPRWGSESRARSSREQCSLWEAINQSNGFEPLKSSLLTDYELFDL